jgi:hypothetical protein
MTFSESQSCRAATSIATRKRAVRSLLVGLVLLPAATLSSVPAFAQWEGVVGALAGAALREALRNSGGGGGYYRGGGGGGRSSNRAARAPHSAPRHQSAGRSVPHHASPAGASQPSASAAQSSASASHPSVSAAQPSSGPGGGSFH